MLAGELISLDSRFSTLGRLVSPGHPWSVVRDSEAAFGVEQDDPAVTVDARLQVVHGLLRDPFGQVAGGHAIAGPLGEDQFHDGLAPARQGGRSALVVRVTATTDQGRVAEAARRL